MPIFLKRMEKPWKLMTFQLELRHNCLEVFRRILFDSYSAIFQGINEMCEETCRHVHYKLEIFFRHWDYVVHDLLIISSKRLDRMNHKCLTIKLSYCLSHRKQKIITINKNNVIHIAANTVYTNVCIYIG